jgi:Tol biopolymer transport system component
VSPESGSGDRLDSWKEIAGYVRRDVKTVQRWEKREGMPVHRHLHDRLGSVFAFKSELDAWARNRRMTAADAGGVAVPEVAAAEAAPALPVRPRRWLVAVAATGVVIAALAAVWVRESGEASADPLANARFQQLTDFNGVEQAAAISRDGKLVAFLSDRDGQMDVWLTQVGSGEFHNLTRGAVPELVNPSVRTLGFSPDETLVTFWARRLDTADRPEIGTWAVPLFGGAPRVYLEGAAEHDWSADSKQLVYHTSGPGDPTFVGNAGDQSASRQIFSAPAGQHSHFPLWSPDGAFIYYVQGSVPDRMDIWRIRPTGGPPERITNHEAAVTYPVFLDRRTLAYLATDRDGEGPWLYVVDVDRRLPRRASAGLDRYQSLAATGDGHRLVATLASLKGTLWRVPIGSEPATQADARAISLTTGNGSAPRMGAGFLLYVTSRGTSDTIWKLQDGRAAELWTSPDSRVAGGPALARDGRRIAFSARRPDGQTLLWVVDSDGTGARTVAASLQLQGAPAWNADGQALTIGARVEGKPSLFRVPVDGGSPVRLLQEHSMDPAWSPSGNVLVFSGADVGTTFPVKAIGADGTPQRIPDLTLSRGARRVVFLADGRSLVVMRGELRHKNLWAIDLQSGAERQLTNFDPMFELRDFDVSPDGREIVVEQVQEQSDIVLLDVQR